MVCDEELHGGYTYGRRVELDFSVNTNPLAQPLLPELAKAAARGLEGLTQYPDMHYHRLREAIARQEGLSPEQVICGNGASELLWAVARAFAPKRALLPAPAYSGYERALSADRSCEIQYYYMKEERQFCLEEDFLPVLSAAFDMVILADPNNPTGQRIPEALLMKICRRCHEEGILPVVDVCYYSLSSRKPLSEIMQPAWELCPKAVFVNAFTKNLALPGLRLGYLMAGDEAVLAKLRRNLPEWNVSAVAEEMGTAAAELLEESDFLSRSQAYIALEGPWLAKQLEGLGLVVFDSEANFLLVKTEAGRKDRLWEGLLEQGILVRDCENFVGLDPGFLRIAIRRHEENKRLIEAMRWILK